MLEVVKNLYRNLVSDLVSQMFDYNSPKFVVLNVVSSIEMRREVWLRRKLPYLHINCSLKSGALENGWSKSNFDPIGKYRKLNLEILFVFIKFTSFLKHSICATFHKDLVALHVCLHTLFWIKPHVLMGVECLYLG